MKKIPVQQTWHHKSCGQCGHIPGYSTSIYWLNRKLGLDYLDPKDQTSCTAWNYYASATSNVAAQAAVAMRNFAAAEETGYFPVIHCGTSFGHYKETRHQLMHSPELRRQVRDIMRTLGKKFVMPEEIVHYSEWVHAMRHRSSLSDTSVTPGPQSGKASACSMSGETWVPVDKTLTELYLIWHYTGVMDIIAEVDEGLHMIILDVMEETLEEAGYEI